MVDEGDLENRTKQWINYIILFNNEQLIQRYNINQSNIPEESRYISCWHQLDSSMVKMNQGVMLTCLFKFFTSISFSDNWLWTLIVKNYNNLDDSGDNFRSYFQKIVILRVAQNNILWNVNWWKKFFYTDSFWSHKFQKKCAKWFIRFWRVNSWNDVQGTFYQQRDKLY